MRVDRYALGSVRSASRMTREEDASMSEDGGSKAERWARFRFSVIGALLAAPPRRGALAEQLRALAETPWRHPISGVPLRLRRSAIERWLQQARPAERDP